MRSNKFLGLLFVFVLFLGVWFTYAVFTKKFTDYDKVSLETSKIGLQLPMRADVKIRGVIVGEALAFESTDDGAVVTLGIYPDQIDTIPKNVTGSIVPKTLFGEKYVALVIPKNPSPQHLEANDVVAPTRVSTEVEQVLSDLGPLLEAVRPADLNMTLTALANALEGKGEELGDTIVALDSYLKKFNPELPAFMEDLRKTAIVSETYAEAIPEIAQILRNSITTLGTIEDRHDQVQTLFSDVAAFSGTAEDFLDANGDNLVRLSDLSAEQLAVFARYAPEYPCLLKGIVKANKLNAESFRGFVLHINLEILPNQPRGYNINDKPRYGADNGPYCGTLPNSIYSQHHIYNGNPNFDDGIDEPTGKGSIRIAPGFGQGSYVGTSDETGLLLSLLSPSLGIPTSQVPGIGAYLLGPMAREGTVSYR